MTNRKLPDIAPCPCGKQCPATVKQVSPGLWRAVSACGMSGPLGYTNHTAREAWNRCTEHGEALRAFVAKVRRIHADTEMRHQFDLGVSEALKDLDDDLAAIERGEVIPAAKPEPKAQKRGRKS